MSDHVAVLADPRILRIGVKRLQRPHKKWEEKLGQDCMKMGKETLLMFKDG